MPASSLHANAAGVSELAMRSLLFVPGDSASKLDKALESGADALIVDIEDSVASSRKAQARATARTFLCEAARTAERPQLWVRVNGLDTGLTDDDLDAILPGTPDAIMLPKAEGGASIAHLDAKPAANGVELGCRGPQRRSRRGDQSGRQWPLHRAVCMGAHFVPGSCRSRG